MKEPPFNTSPQAVELRRSAMAWVKHGEGHEGYGCGSDDAHDREHEKLNKKLLAAAAEYGKRVIEEQAIQDTYFVSGAYKCKVCKICGGELYDNSPGFECWPKKPYPHKDNCPLRRGR
jgi:hypothetical protein